MLHQSTPNSHPLGLTVRLGTETLSLLTTVWEELGEETHGDMSHLSLPQTTTLRVRPHGSQHPYIHTQSPQQRGRWES